MQSNILKERGQATENGIHVPPPSVGSVAENAFVQAVTAPYVSKNCVYVTKVERISGGGVGARLRARFSIPASCYIDDTGHFNAVEFNICYNQMMYILIADSVARFEFPELNGWQLDEFFRKQLSNMLIVRLQSRFVREIDSRDFVGDCSIDRVIKRGGGPAFIKTSVSFFDRRGGAADGKVDLAIVP